MAAFAEGVLAGYGIAIPVGAIAVLILDVSLRRGFRVGFMAGAGAAFADFLYATLAAVAGGALAQILAPYGIQVKVVSGFVLILVGMRGLMRSLRPALTPELAEASTIGRGKVFAQFLGLTLINPLTIAYFSALILGGAAGHLDTVLEYTLFVIGAGLASLSWQTLLAGLGSLGHDRLSPRFQIAASILGFLVVIGFGLRILIPLV